MAKPPGGTPYAWGSGKMIWEKDKAPENSVVRLFGLGEGVFVRRYSLLEVVQNHAQRRQQIYIAGLI
jgi:hypothetical protein